MRAELFSSSFARLTSKMTLSNFTLTQKPKTRLLGPFDMTSSESKVSAYTGSELDRTLSRYAINPRTAPYIDGENCA